MMQRTTMAKEGRIRPEMRNANLKTIGEAGAQTNLDEVDSDEKISLLVGAIWLICGILSTILEPENIFFTLFLSVGIFFSVYALTKTQKL
jgi:hypothetical protein